MDGHNRIDFSNQGSGLIEILFDLGKLRVFHEIESADKVDLMPSKVYWADMQSMRKYGPFTSIWAAMEHYAWMAQSTKQKQIQDSRPNATIIHYDFTAKSRITFPIPGELNEIPKR